MGTLTAGLADNPEITVLSIRLGIGSGNAGDAVIEVPVYFYSRNIGRAFAIIADGARSFTAPAAYTPVRIMDNCP
jgi:hypothetical protein